MVNFRVCYNSRNNIALYKQKLVNILERCSVQVSSFKMAHIHCLFVYYIQKIEVQICLLYHFFVMDIAITPTMKLMKLTKMKVGILQ